MIDTFNFLTRKLDPSERFGRYRDLYSYGSDSIELGSPVAAELKAWRLGELILFERRLAGLGSERLAPRVRRNQFDHFTVQLNLRGDFHGDGSDGFKAVRPGEILLLDMSKSSRTRMPNVHLVTLSVPRAVIESAGAATDKLHGLVVPVERAAPLADFLASERERAEVLSPPDPLSASAVVARFCARQMEAVVGLGAQAVSGWRAASASPENRCHHPAGRRCCPEGPRAFPGSDEPGKAQTSLCWRASSSPNRTHFGGKRASLAVSHARFGAPSVAPPPSPDCRSASPELAPANSQPCKPTFHDPRRWPPKRRVGWRPSPPAEARARSGHRSHRHGLCNLAPGLAHRTPERRAPTLR
jgi:hypothetical protein